MNRFCDNSNDTITDKSTGLVWIKNIKKINSDHLQKMGDIGSKKRKWKEAAEKVINNIPLEGDWHLPSVEELFSLLDYSNPNAGFTLPQSLISLTSLTFLIENSTHLSKFHCCDIETPNGSLPCWQINIRSGEVRHEFNSSDYGLVWPVKGKLIVQDLENTDSKNPLTFKFSGLEWWPVEKEFKRSEVKEQCNNKDWRLPTVKELGNLMFFFRLHCPGNYKCGSPSYIPGGLMMSSYWSETEVESKSLWVVDFIRCTIKNNIVLVRTIKKI